MRGGLLLFASLAAFGAGASHCSAGSTSIGATFTTERQPDAFDSPKGSDWQLNLSHGFDNDVSLSATVKFHESADAGAAETNVQFGLSYRYQIGELSLTGTIGSGQHFIHSDDPTSFPYYYVMLSGSAPITEKWTWNIFRVRYRNAFDGSSDYNTPEIASGFDFSIDTHNAVSLMIERDWSNGKASYTGIEIGYRYRF